MYEPSKASDLSDSEGNMLGMLLGVELAVSKSIIPERAAYIPGISTAGKWGGLTRARLGRP